MFWLIFLTKTWRQYKAYFKNNLGVYLILPLIQGLSFGNKIFFYKNFIKFIFFVTIGSLLLLKFIPLLSIISNVGVVNNKYAISNGTYSIITQKTPYFVFLKLPSCKIVKLSSNYWGFLGRNSGFLSNSQYFTQASSIYNNKTLQVRGVAKNPIDHPNGGRTRGKMLFRTPWGLVAKHNK